MLGDGTIERDECEMEEGENDGGLRNNNAGRAERVADEPSGKQQGNLSGQQGGRKSEKTITSLVRAGDDVTGSGIADNELTGDNEGGINSGKEQSDRGRAEENRHQGLEVNHEVRRTWLDEDEPDAVGGGEYEMGGCKNAT